ncbi:MAG TPA: SsrA-binding protein SmpB [Prolixibacteraceae bacterium]|nr:SsrA-binding protein SmpB [Bacteroidales bacterium]HNZ71542.1 SsrA-binding protein SmpB [Prolixibacteraceae bacterium]HUM88730.1 SsrA-binding protein SmpB [Prolixibacteraceae bacterium]
MALKPRTDVSIKNKKAFFEYEIIESFIAGIQLQGTEIKSIREGKAGLVDSYCQFAGGELYVKNMHIAEYFFGNLRNHEAKRERKLLLQKKELRKLERKVRETGLTIVPLKLFLNEKGFAKLEIGLARGKKVYDKRESLKQNDARRDMDREMKY